MDWTMKVRTDEKLVVFIYSLLQRGVHVSQIEQAVDSATDILKQGNTVELCNGPLAVVAQEAARVISGNGTIKVGKEDGVVCSKCETVFMAHDMNKAENRTCCPKCGEKWNTKGKDEEDPLEILLAKPVDHLEPNIRVRNILEKAGAKTIRDIVKMTRRDFLRYRGAGPKSLEELKEVLAKYGLALKSKKIG